MMMDSILIKCMLLFESEKYINYLFIVFIITSEQECIFSL
jgi:hypothetical protein